MVVCVIKGFVPKNWKPGDQESFKSWYYKLRNRYPVLLVGSYNYCVCLFPVNEEGEFRMGDKCTKCSKSI